MSAKYNKIRMILVQSVASPGRQHKVELITIGISDNGDLYGWGAETLYKGRVFRKAMNIASLNVGKYKCGMMIKKNLDKIEIYRELKNCWVKQYLKYIIPFVCEKEDANWIILKE